MRNGLIAALLFALAAPAAASAEARMVRVEGGTYRPVFPPSPEEKEIPVGAFLLDERPVTNGEYLAFVKANPRWRKGQVPRLFAGAGYLDRWEGPLLPGAKAPADAPVVEVSWFTAKAFCEAQGKRLPTEAEWEYVASASADAPDARQDPAFLAQLLSWYAKPNPKVFGPVGQGAPNYHGVHDLHGLIWEWVGDFNSALVVGDSREDGDPDLARFCGAGALSAQDKSDYAAFMRIAFRSSLQASYTTKTRGFRCARDVKETK